MLVPYLSYTIVKTSILLRVLGIAMRMECLTLAQIEPWAELLALAFGRRPAEMRALLAWFHAGEGLIAWGAWEGSQLVAQYSSWLTALRLPGEAVPARVGLCVNLAVHPAYRGRGLVKQVAGPVYTALAERGGVAGVGFSNAAGVQVDRRSQGYGYRVVGQLAPLLVFLRRERRPCVPVTLTEQWPAAPWRFAGAEDEALRFAATPETVAWRFAAHPFRRYHYGVWLEDGAVRGLVVARPVRWGGLPGATLLAAYSDDLPALLAGWAAALRAQGGRFIHALATPCAAARAAWRPLGLSLTLPYSRSPYYLTIKPLQETLTPLLLDFSRWDCLGGDIL